MRRIPLLREVWPADQYNPWSNYETWTVWKSLLDYADTDASWPLYQAAVQFMGTYTGDNPYPAFVQAKRSVLGQKNFFDVAWDDPALDIAELNKMMFHDFVPEERKR